MRVDTLQGDSVGRGEMILQHGGATRSKFRAAPQVEPEAYDERYLHPGRVANYARQLMEVQRLKPDRVLEVGIGGGLMRGIAERHLSVPWLTCDIDARLKPDVAATVSALPFADNAFDLVACCQVLEHLPFSHFATCLRELARVSRRHVIISLPDIRRYYAICLCLPKLGWVRWEINIERLGRRVLPFRGEHYWEIGYTGTRWRQVRQMISSVGLRFRISLRLPEHSYHHFMLLAPP